MINCEYEAVDIREDSLSLCNCPTYTKIPTHRNYDLVCLFGTIGLLHKSNSKSQKKLFKTLLAESKKIATKYLVFTTIKDTTLSSHHVLYSREETEELGIHFSKKYSILENCDPCEWTVVCQL